MYALCSIIKICIISLSTQTFVYFIGGLMLEEEAASQAAILLWGNVTMLPLRRMHGGDAATYLGGTMTGNDVREMSRVCSLTAGSCKHVNYMCSLINMSADFKSVFYLSENKSCNISEEHLRQWDSPLLLHLCRPCKLLDPDGAYVHCCAKTTAPGNSCHSNAVITPIGSSAACLPVVGLFKIDLL